MIKILLLAIVFGVVLCKLGRAQVGSSSSTSTLASADEDLTPVFDLLNGHLKHIVKSFDEETYMWESINWLETQLKAISSFDKNRLSGALELLKALSKLKYDSHCDRKSLEVLRNVDRATGGKAHYRYYAMKLARPIDKMVHYFFVRHAIACTGLYPKLLKDMLAQKDANIINMVDSVANGLVMSKIIRKTLTPYENGRYELRWRETEGAQVREDLRKFTKEEIEGFTRFLSLDSLENPLELLEHLSADDDKKRFLKPILDENLRKMVVEENQVELLYQTNLITPCRTYLAEMADLFLVAEFDDQVTDIHPRDKETMIDFFMGRAGYSLCSLLVNQSQLRTLRKVITAVKQN